MKLSELIQAAAAGRTLRQVLEAAHGKPAEEIGVEGQELAEYQHDLDSPITAVYTAASDIALVAGETVWQDCGTMNAVSSADILADEFFRRRWDRVYPAADHARMITVAVIEAGEGWTDRVARLVIEVSGDEQTMIEQAKAAVAARGYRVMPDTEGGCCAYQAVSGGEDYIGISVYLGKSWLESALPEGAIEEAKRERAAREARKAASLWHCRIPYCRDGGGMIAFWANPDGGYECDDTRISDKDIRELIKRFAAEWA